MVTRPYGGWNDWSRTPTDAFYPVVVDNNHLGDVQLSEDFDSQTRRERNLLYAQIAIDDVFPKYNPKSRIHELSISIEIPKEDRMRAVISAVVKAMKLDEAFEEEISLFYLKNNGA